MVSPLILGTVIIFDATMKKISKRKTKSIMADMFMAGRDPAKMSFLDLGIRY